MSWPAFSGHCHSGSSASDRTQALRRSARLRRCCCVLIPEPKGRTYKLDRLSFSWFQRCRLLPPSRDCKTCSQDLARLPHFVSPCPKKSQQPRYLGRYWTWPADGRTSIRLTHTVHFGLSRVAWHHPGLRDAAFTLRTGAHMPAIGFGTWRLWAKDAYQPVRWALEVGYRHIDTAEGYANEAEIGRAILDSGVPRSEIFLATKASSVPKGLADISYASDIFAFQLVQLGTDYVDLYMMHTPPSDPQLLQQVWRIMESFYEQGRARALGVSNCDVRELRQILEFATVPPAYVQNLFKIYKPGEQIPVEDVVAFAHRNQLVVVGYSVQTEWPHIMVPLQDPHLLTIASHVGRTPSQVLHRWTLQRGVGVIPKSATRQRILENSQLLDFEPPSDKIRHNDCSD